ncbi:ParB/RepB/Spo0J family partition protein [Brevibacillus humidisoli]|uniref:ParB/RepB/Spo0J family partition protein n=1 Tax=Brevibacillus humidisoli TaxID=2895522 RepID=UPI001E372FA7|nr:ParB/RepB/Spo0J family partition protein [Brevibacillus humidisoli]UFJ40438.1 ParB/RepB/Spo0J family partition protein [Brevibacillus humidisoli]
MSKRLGKGLSALIPPNILEEGDQVTEVAVAEIRPNPYQPRKEFDPEALQELAESIKEHGIIQPLIVRKSIKGYELVAGERRLRAAKEAGLATVPVVIKTYSDQQLMEIALIENLQRENLNPIEEAEAYQKLIDHCSYTQDELAQKVGKSRPHVANMLRLLHLPERIRKLVSTSALSMGHARAILPVENHDLQWQLANDVIKQELSVRQLEEIVKELSVSRETKGKGKKPVKKEPMIHQMEERLRSRFGTLVQIRTGARKGKIEIEFYSNDDLERILELLES